jgi:hypothetical protein
MSAPQSSGRHVDLSVSISIKRGLPVGIKAMDGKVYLLVGPNWRRGELLNSQLAEYAAKTVTVKGKVGRRDGFAMLADATVVSFGVKPAVPETVTDKHAIIAPLALFVAGKGAPNNWLDPQ